MTDINITFSRQMLKQVHADVRAALAKLAVEHIRPDLVRANLMTAAWTYNCGRDHWEFHGPDDFYWHGRASNAYEARYKGWMAWLRLLEPEAA